MLGRVVAVVLCAAAAAPALASELSVATEAGFPDGLALSIVTRPLEQVRLSVGATYFGGGGIRGTIELVPFAWRVAPAVAFAVSHSAGTDASGLAERLLGMQPRDAALLRHVVSDIYTAQLGVDVGVKRGLVAFARAGVGYAVASPAGFAAALSARNDGTVRVIAADPVIRSVLPTARLGVLVSW